MIEHLPILLIITPLISAVIIALLQSLKLKLDRIEDAIALTGLTLPFFYIVLLFKQLSVENIEYYLGGWKKPYGITLVVDHLSILLALTTAILTFLCYVYSLSYMKTHPDKGKYKFFFLLMATGLYGVFLTGDIFNLYVFFEITVVATYILITFSGRKTSLKASFNYLVLGTLGCFLFLLAIGLIYYNTGVLNLAEISQRIGSIDMKTQAIIFVLLFGAVGIKTAIIPFHFWLPDAHSTAPSPISAILSGITVKVGVYVLLRTYGLGFTLPYLKEVVVLLGALTALLAVFAALAQYDMKRILAYHTISQMGYIVVGIGVATSLGVTAGIYHIVNHAIFKALLFLCAGSLLYATKTRDIREYGVGISMPVTMLTCIIASLSISGIPPFNGYVSTSLIFSSVDAYPILEFILIIATIGTVASFLKIIYYSFIKSENAKKAKEVPLSMQLPMLVLAGLCIVLGIMPNLLLSNFMLPAAETVLIIPFEYVFDFSKLFIWSIAAIEILIVVLGILLLKWSIVKSETILRFKDKMKTDLNVAVFFTVLALAVIAVIFRMTL